MDMKHEMATIGPPAVMPNISGANRDDQLVALWLSGRPDNTKRAYGHEIWRFYRYVGKPLARVTASDLIGYAESLARDGLKLASQYRALSAVKSYMGYAHRLGYIPVNPSVAIRMPQPQQDRAAKLLPVEAVQAVIACASPGRNRLICQTLYTLALRESELCGLNADDIHASAISVRGKGGKVRHIATPAYLTRALMTHAQGIAADAPLFQSRSGARLCPSDIYRIVRAAGETAGYRISPHWLRHAHASHALDNDAPLHVVRDTLGHASLSTTSIYSHAKPTDGSALYLKE